MSRILFVGNDPISVSYLGSASTSGGGSVKTASSFSFGTEHVARQIIIAVHAGLTGSSLSLNSATIGGVSASILVGDTGDNSGIILGTWLIAAEPSGASGDVVLTFSGSASCTIKGWRSLNVSSLTPTDTDSRGWASSSNSTRSITPDTPENGLLIAASYTNHDNIGTPLTAMSGIGIDYDLNSGTAHYFGGSETPTPDETGRTITVTKGAGALNMAGALVAAAFR